MNWLYSNFNISYLDILPTQRSHVEKQFIWPKPQVTKYVLN